MPVGIQRLNAPRLQPSSQIIFIKPLPGPGKEYAQDFLERIAAICHPIMKANYLSIMTLEEHEPNPEFIGRNFNAGEIIQLVLKAPYSGHWLSFRSVQMVMMHELAHCVQMNHSAAFWKVNNQYKGELRELWGRNYTGDGLWGGGRTLLSGEYHTGISMENEVLPANLCGGTFRSSRRGKRKRGGEKPKETYAERQQRRIKKKFGVNGQTLGNDTETGAMLEHGKKPKGKPRVAGSARGRELRAAAALARFEQVKEETKREEESLFGDSETESDGGGEDGSEAFDLDGSRMKDGKGRGMIKVCEGEDRDDPHVKREIEELHELEGDGRHTRLEHPSRHAGPACNSPTPVSNVPGPSTRARQIPRQAPNQPVAAAPSDDPNIRLHDIPLYVEKKDIPAGKKEDANKSEIRIRPARVVSATLPQPSAWRAAIAPKDTAHDDEKTATNERDHDHTTGTRSIQGLGETKVFNCPICSMENEPASLLCTACSHVLDTNKVTRYWRCQSDACKGNGYINAADCGLCGVCGARMGEEGLRNI